jgi:ABC-type antimicrobial peptide transport system permease subunit
VLAAFAASAGLLIGVGVFGLVTYIVAMDARGIGVRMALGASPGTVLASVLSRSIIWAGLGGVAGLGLALAVTRIVRVPAFQLDPVSAVLGAIAILGLTVMASWLPAWRASRTDPLIAIRGR